MPKLVVVLMNWIKMKGSDMAAFARGVVTNMTDNLNFPTPDVPLTDLTSAAVDVENAYGNRKNSLSGESDLQDAVDILNKLLHDQAYYVNAQAGGTISVIESAGYQTTKNFRSKRDIPATCAAPSVTGNSAKLMLKVPKVPGAASYFWVIYIGAAVTATVNGNVVNFPQAAMLVIPCGKTVEYIRGVIPTGTVINVQVLAQNSAGMGGFSSLINFTVGG